MELRLGYKHTEAGVIPEDWDVVPLGGFVRITSGDSPSLVRFTSIGKPYFKVEQLSNGDKYLGVFSTPYHFIDGKTVPRRSVIFAKRGAAIALNKIRILSEESFMDTNLMALTPKDGLDFEYLYYGLGYIGLWRFADTTSVPQINNKHINPLPFPLPKETEQREIASALNDVDVLLATLDQVIAKKRDLKQAAMQQLLTGEARLPGFSGNWEVKQLGDIGQFLKGRGVKKDEAQSGTLPCIRYGEIYTHHNDYIKSFNSWISPQVAATATRLKQGDLLFAGSGETKEEIGKCVAFIDDCEAYAGGDTVILRAAGINPMFMGYYCNTAPIAAQKASKGQGDAVVHISAAALSSIVLALPSLSEQNAIATALSSMDSELSVLVASRDKTRNIKQAMMQELLTGKTRLV
ncbi:MAG: restriction endonuclease subunit S [Methylophilaceae bacterium]|nr:restriction endonuclease subunit S [Methylophilaceae bacterium]